MWMREALLVALIAVGMPNVATARTLVVGAAGPFHGLNEALEKARPGDTISVGPGEYFECATIAVPDLIIQGAGAATVFTDRTCSGKALLIGRADNLTLRDLVLTRARVPDMNGAGIRMEGKGLVVERVQFVNDQVGVMGGFGGVIRLTECLFERGGVAGDRPGNVVWVVAADHLLIERSTFRGVKGGQISSNANLTELVGNRIETGVEPGAGHAVTIAGGMLVMRDNVVVVGPNLPPRSAAVAVNGGGAELRGNRLENTTGQRVDLLLDWMRASPVLDSNIVPAGDSVSTTNGLWRHRAGILAHGAVDEAREMAALAKRSIKSMLGR